MIGAIAERILALHGWAALAVVFLLPALESSAFLGFVKTDHLERAERYLQRRGGKAVFFGRFTAALRVMIPGLAGMSGLRYRRFLAYNAAGGALWATGFVLAGYVAGDSWRDVEHIAGRAGVVLLLLAVLAGAVALSAQWVGRHQDRLRAVVSEQLERPKVAALYARYQRQLGFLGRRFQPGGAFGLSLTASLVALVAAGWMLGAVVQDVVVGQGSARFDRPVMEWFARHREPWLTKVMWVVTTFGSSAVLIPLGLAVGVWYWWRRKAPRPFLLLFAAYVGSELLSETVRALTKRDRPPAHLAAGHFAGFAFPSGHATHSVAVYGMLAVVLAGSTPLWRQKVAVWTGAFSIATAVGLSRLYLGAHWLTDVLGGFALGNLWLFLVVVAARAIPGLRSGSATSLGAPP